MFAGGRFLGEGGEYIPLSAFGDSDFPVGSIPAQKQELGRWRIRLVHVVDPHFAFADIKLTQCGEHIFP